MLIRKYKKSDRKAIERINFETGFLGKSMKKIIGSRNLWNSSVSYYLEKEPESAFVVEENGKVFGYLLGSVTNKRIPILKYYLKGIFRIIFALPNLQPKDFYYWKGRTLYLVHSMLGKYGRQRVRFPKKAGHLHIDIMDGHRGENIGSKMLEEFFKYARGKGVKKIYANSYETDINPTTHFWLKNGFTEHDRIQSHFWDGQFPNEKIYLVCYVKKLE